MRQSCMTCHAAHYTERGGCSNCHRGNPLTERKTLAHAGLRSGKYVRYTRGDSDYRRRGERVMEERGCRRCHVSGGRGNRLAASLDDATGRKTVDEMAQSIRRPAAGMPDFRLGEEDITLVINSMLAGAPPHSTESGRPMTVNFSDQGGSRPDIFSRKCGSCHRIISRRSGLLGTGSVAPNLSGLFSEYYPGGFRNGESWNMKNLRTWLKNPRAVRKSSGMQPVQLTGRETAELEAIVMIH